MLFLRSFFILIFLVSIHQCTIFQRSVKISPVTFDYQAISKNYFSPTQSNPFPLTVQRGNNLFSSTTADGRYLFYTTDQKGNYDIWFRDLQSSVVVPVTNHPFSESKPAISPDGKHLVFVSEEFDSDGDLVLLNMDIEKWMSELLNGNRFIDQDTVNLTNRKAANKGNKQRIIDTDPVWSPDGKFILFVTDRFTPGLPNLALLNPKNPEIVKQITQDGAVNPSFSRSGDQIFFISYKDDKRGEIYSLKLQDLIQTRITENAFLDYSPSVDAKGMFLYYSSIRQDTNKNGKLDDRDASFLVMRKLSTGKERLLSSGETSFFDVRYSGFNGGSILFSAPFSNSINIYFLPENGSIPKQATISDQYQYAKTQNEKQSLESYFLALDSLELFFSEDPLYPIYSGKVNFLKILHFQKLGNFKSANLLLKKMISLPKTDDSYFEIGLGRWLNGNLKSRNAELENYIKTVSTLSLVKDTIPSLIHILVDDFEKQHNGVKTSYLLNRIHHDFPEYHQIHEIKRRIGGYEFNPEAKTLPLVYKEIFSNWEHEKVRFETSPLTPFSSEVKRDLRFVVEDLLLKIESTRNYEELALRVEELQQVGENQENPLFSLMLKYLRAKSLSEARKFTESNAILDTIIPILTNIELEPPGKPSIFDFVPFQAAYKNPILLRAHLLKYRNQKAIGNTADALRNMKIYLEFYDPSLGVELNADEIQNAFFYFENKALEFERMGDLFQASFHYFFNNQNMFLVKTRNLYLDTLYKEYAVCYQRKMVDTIFDYGKKLREEEERALLSQINILGKDKLNVIGNISDVTSVLTDNKYFRSVVDIKDLERIEVLSSEALKWTELYYKQAVPRARPHLDLATLYGYSYFLINKYVIFESYYYATGTMTDARKKEILENFKKAEWELKWIIFADPTYHDAYQLLGWLYQYIDLVKQSKKDGNTIADEEVYDSLYKRFFPEKNLEANVELYSQILVFLGDSFKDPKIISDLNLNLGNNLFLLNNYPKANESYAKVESSSKHLLSKNQFENYRQEAVFCYNFGRSLIYQGKYQKAIEQFDKSITIYFKKEYYQAVNSQASENSQRNIDGLANVRSKIALLFSLKGLSELESQKYGAAAVSLQTAIAYNSDINFVNPINLYNYLAIAFQKAGRFKDSYSMLSLAETEYEKSREGFFKRVKNWSLWNLILPNDTRVIGEGRFPGEFPNDFKYLLTLGIRIENHIEQREFSLALKELESRNLFISDRSLNETVIGLSILAKSKQVEAQIHYENKEYGLALTSFEELVNLVIPQKSEESTLKAFGGYASSIFSYLESNPESLKIGKEKLIVLLGKLEDWKESVNINCAELDCDLQFRRKFIQYDIIKGNTYFYLGELETIALNLESSVNYYASAAFLLENPGELDPREIGLSSDPLRRKERIRILQNLSNIYFRLGDISLFEKKWKEAYELAFEFRMEEEMFWLTNLKLEVTLDSKLLPKIGKIQLQKSIVADLKKSWKNKPELRLFSKRTYLDRFIHLLSEHYISTNEMELLPSIWEERRNIDLFREVIGAQFEFEDTKLNLAYGDLLSFIKNYKRLVASLEEKSLRRENLTAILRSQEIEIAKFSKLLSGIKELSLNRSAFFDLLDEIPVNFPTGWLGVYRTESLAYLMSYDLNRLTVKSCDWETLLESCNITLSSPQIFVQGLGTKFTNKEAEKIASLLNNQKKQISFIFDRNHVIFFEERIERNWKWATLISDETKKDLPLAVRISKNGELGSLLYDTDILVSDRLRNFGGSLFGDVISELLPLREVFATSGSEISVTAILLENLREKSDWNRLGLFYEVLRSKRIQNLIGFRSKAGEQELLSGNPNLTLLSKQSDIIIFGNWSLQKSYEKKQLKATELLSKGFLHEKEKNFSEAYDYYYTASTLIEDTDKRLPELELKLAKLKVELFPSYSKRIFFEPLWKKYSGTESENRIRYEYMVSCYSDKLIEDCGDLEKGWVGSQAEIFKKATKFYHKLRVGHIGGLKKFDEARRQLELSEDPFLQSYRIGTLYIQNFLFKEAEEELRRTYSIAKSAKEKSLAKNRELEILYHKGLLYGDKAIFLTSLTSTSAYSLGFRKQWKDYDEKINSREFTKFGYADSIYDRYRKKMYQSWKDQQNKGYFDPLQLTPEFLTTGLSVLGKLSHLNRSLMFSLLRKSVPLQKKNEVNALVDLIIREEQREVRPMRILAFKLFYARALFIRGDVEEASRYLQEFESAYEKLEYGNRFFDEEYLNLKFIVGHIFQKQIPGELLAPNEFTTLYPKISSASPDSYISILNELCKGLKNEYLSEYMRDEFELLFVHMLNQSLNKNSSEVFFDIAIARDLVRAYNERFRSEKVFVKDLPIFEHYSERLKKKLPPSQELSALVDVGRKTYLLGFNNNKSIGRELFLDNKEVNRSILNYFLEADLGGMETLLRDSVSDRYKNSMRLTKGKRHYLYLTGLHSKVPIQFPDIEYYLIGSVSKFLENPSIPRSQTAFKSLDTGMLSEAKIVSPDDQLTMDLMSWEVETKQGIKESNIDFTDIDWSLENFVSYGGLPVGKRFPQKRKGLYFYANSRIGEKSFYSDDYSVLNYYISQNSEGPYLIHSGHQRGTHNIRFAKQFFTSTEVQKPLTVRLEEAREIARTDSPEDRYWTGFRLFTSSIIVDD